MSIWERFCSWWWGKPREAMLSDEGLVTRDSIDRSVLVVRAAEPFKRWATRAIGERLKDTHEMFAKDYTAYLVPREDSEEVNEEVLAAIYENIFERELLSWSYDREQWPAPRTLAMFREWFELETCTLVVDLVDGAIVHDEGERRD